MKRNKSLRTYLLTVFIIMFFTGVIYPSAKDFFFGFFAGWNGVTNEYSMENYGMISFMYSCVTTALLALVCGFLFGKIKKKVTAPIERLANAMQEVSKGNLSARVPADSSFELYRMEEAFNDMAAGLESAKKESEERENREKLLYAGIAHDLKTPMTMIIGYAKLLQNKSDITGEERNSYLETIAEQTAHANELLDTMLAYSKLSSSYYELNLQNGDIAELLRTSTADCYAAFEESGFDVDIHTQTERLVCCFDSVEMKRVFHNLLNNMIKHNSENTACVIDLSEKDNGTIEIVFADNGSKIPTELQNSLFDPFAVGDKSRNTKDGSGLGLSVCKKIVERHGGNIRYADEWGNGFKAFIIMLPIVK